MYKLKEIADKVYYVGVNDRQKALFENMWPLPYGVSYNSYLIVDEKTVLVDTVDVCYSDIFLKKNSGCSRRASFGFFDREPYGAGSCGQYPFVAPAVSGCPDYWKQADFRHVEWVSRYLDGIV